MTSLGNAGFGMARSTGTVTHGSLGRGRVGQCADMQGRRLGRVQ